MAESTAAYFLRAPAIASPAYTVANTRKTAPTPDVSRVKSTMAMTMNYRAATAAIVTGDVTLRVIGRVLGDRTSLTRSGSPFMRPSPHAGLVPSKSVAGTPPPAFTPQPFQQVPVI